MSTKELAAKVGTTQGTVSRLETGTQAITMEWLEKLSYAIGVKPSALIDDTVIYAAMRGDLRSDREHWPLLEGDEVELLPVPTLFDLQVIGGEITAFRISDRALVFCDRGGGTLSKNNVGRLFVLHVQVPLLYDGLCLAEFFDHPLGPCYYHKQGLAIDLQLSARDKRISNRWRVLTRYEAM